MKTIKSKELLKPFIDQCEKDKDCYMIVHFSKQEDKFYGLTDMDAGDALVIIHELINQYKLNPKAI